jgi:hypothetical protein
MAPEYPVASPPTCWPHGSKIPLEADPYDERAHRALVDLHRRAVLTSWLISLKSAIAVR